MEKRTEDNVTRQGEEIEALRSIYNDDFSIEDEFGPTFSIVIRVGPNEGEEATLVVSFNPDYPNKAPPIYHLSIPWMRGPEKQILCSSLDQLYLNHVGESIVYIWVEQLREVLLAKNLKTFHPASDPDTSVDAISLDQTSSQLENVNQNTLPVITTGIPLTDRKSTFQAHVAAVTTVQQVKMVVTELLRNKKIASATHNMYAFRIFNESTQTWSQDCLDDGELHAGGRLLHLLQILGCRNVLVVVTRWYGGIMLYGDRFKHINNVARQVLNEKGFIPNTSGVVQQ